MPKSANAYVANAVIAALHKGENGTGKSIASLSPLLRPTYVLDFEDRMASAISYWRKKEGHVNDVEYDTYALGEGYYPIKKRLDELKEGSKYKTIVAATLTSYVDIVLEHLITSKAGAKNVDGGDKGKKIGGIAVNVLEDFNAETAAIVFELLETFKYLQKRGKNIIIEAHVLTHEYKSGNEVKTARPLVTGGKKAAAKIPGYFNEVFHFYADAAGFSGNTKYTVATRHNGDDSAKTSFQDAPALIDWTGKDFYEELFRYIPKEQQEAERETVKPTASW